MPNTETLANLLTASPVTLALILGLAAVGVAGMSLFVLLKLAGRERRE